MCHFECWACVCSTVQLSIGQLQWSLGQWVIHSLWSHVLCVYVLAVCVCVFVVCVYMSVLCGCSRVCVFAHAAFSLSWWGRLLPQGEVLNPIVSYRYRHGPSHCHHFCPWCLWLFTDDIHIEWHWLPAVVTEVHGFLHVSLSDINTILMIYPITPVKSMSGNHRAEAEELRG